MTVLSKEKTMCKASYECPYGTPEEYKPSPEVKAAMEEALVMLSKLPDAVQPVGKRFLGVQKLRMMGGYHDVENNQLVDVAITYIDRGRIVNSLLNPHRPRQSIRTISVAHISLDAPTGAEPYRLFFYHVPTGKLDTCFYDDYQADGLAVSGFGTSEIMRERYEEAVRLGEDIVTSQQEADLVRSLLLGTQVGWQTKYTD